MDTFIRIGVFVSAWAAFGYAPLAPAMSPIEQAPVAGAVILNADCTKTKCRGNFPVSPTRYAEGEDKARNEITRT